MLFAIKRNERNWWLGPNVWHEELDETCVYDATEVVLRIRSYNRPALNNFRAPGLANYLDGGLRIVPVRKVVTEEYAEVIEL